MIKKKKLLLGSAIVAILAGAIGTLEPFRLCRNLWRECMDVNYTSTLILLPFIPLFLFSLVTYKMRDEVYRAWLRFSCIWIPLSMLAIFSAPEYSSDWMYPVEKGTVAFFSSVLYGIISIVIIIWKYTGTKRKD